MDAFLWFLLAAFLGLCAFAAAPINENKKTKKNKTKNNQDNNDDDNGFMDTLIVLGAMDYMSDGELDGNFSDEY